MSLPLSEILYIITPCARPSNLRVIRTSLSSMHDWVWVIVYSTKPDVFQFAEDPRIHEVWCGLRGKDDHEGSTYGNMERNYGISLIPPSSEAYVYFLDDDNLVHPYFWSTVYPVLQRGVADFITFDQQRTLTQVLRGPVGKVYHMDTAMFVSRRSLVGDVRWRLWRYDADGLFAEEMQARAQNHVYVPCICALYNVLMVDQSQPIAIGWGIN